MTVADAVASLERRWGITHHTAVHLLRLIGAVGGRTTSGRRSRLANLAARGRRNSDHLWGGAFDHVPSRDRWHDALRFLISDRCGPDCRGPRIVLDEGNHIHWSDRR